MWKIHNLFASSPVEDEDEFWMYSEHFLSSLKKKSMYISRTLKEKPTPFISHFLVHLYISPLTKTPHSIFKKPI